MEGSTKDPLTALAAWVGRIEKRLDVLEKKKPTAVIVEGSLLPQDVERIREWMEGDKKETLIIEGKKILVVGL